LISLSLGQSLQGLKVSGNQLVNGNGQVVKLRGVDRSGTEFACIGGYGIFDGPNDQASIDVIKTWKVNIIRVPLNEDCWLNINGVKPQYGGQNYQNAISNYVDLLNRNGIVAILDLHWAAPGSTPATAQTPMPDMDHSPTFWQQVAQKFANNSMAIFDLFNEPYPGNNAWDGSVPWTCWRDGGNCQAAGIQYTVAGMQLLVDTVRKTGATNVIICGGLAYSNSLGMWMQYMPHDPLGQTIPSWHTYNFNRCINTQCWESDIAPLAAKFPIIASEIGENDCAGNFINTLLPWMDAHGLHYLAWTWNTWNCTTGPALITNYDGTPTGFGAPYKAYLLSHVD